MLINASRPVIENIEPRMLLSATLTPSSTLLVFNAVKGTTSVTETLTLTDTGTSPLTLGSGAFALANDPSSATQDSSLFSLTNAASAPATLSPGQSFGLTLDYSATAVVTNKAFLEITTNDAVNPTQEISLHGIGTKGLGGSNQPSLATILQAYNIPTYVGEGFDDDNAATDSIYPNPPDASSQEVVMQRFVKAGSGPVTINVLASFTASGFPKSYVLGTYTPGEPTTLSELFYTPSSENQTTYVQPQGSTSFDPGTNPFGFYFISNVQTKGRVGYSEDALNTWDTTNPRKMRFFPMETPSGTIVPNTYIMTSTEWNAPVGYDFTNIVAIVSNITAAPGAPSAPVLGLQNLNAVPGSNTMVFSRIQIQNSTVGDTVHDTGTLQVNNTGNSPLIISSYTLDSSWTLVSPPTFPVTVAAGGHLDLSVKFIATTLPSVPYNETNSDSYPNEGGVYDGNLVLNSNDPNNPTSTVPLRGYWQYKSENSNEPGFMTLANLMFGWDTYINSHPITTLYETDAVPSSPNYFGEEVVSPYWQQADASQNITVQQIAGYHTQGNTATTYYYMQGSSGSTTKLFETGADYGQTVFPAAINTTTPASATFNTTGTFGFKVDAEFSDDSLNTLKTGGGHHFRFYPIRDSSGNLVPNTYIMTMDYSNSPQNFDFQDNVYVVSNIRPAVAVSGIGSEQSTAAPPAPTDVNALSASGVNTIQWAAPLYSNIAGYNIFRSTGGPLGTFTKINTSLVTGTTYSDSNSPASATSTYKIETVDSATGYHSLGTDASVVDTTTSTTGTGAPVAAAESVSTNAGTQVTINVVSDATDNANGTIVAGSVVVTTAPAHGSTAVDPTTGLITYTPAAGYTGTDTFQYTISDTTGAVSAPATVTVNVSSTPIGSPVAANLSYSVQENSLLSFNVASAATDNASATIVPSSVVITEPPTHGTAVIDPTTGNITYTPASGYQGKDTFEYTIADSLSAVSQPAIVTLTISKNATSSGPQTAPITTPASSSGGGTVINVLSSANDSTGTLNPATVTVVSLPAHGTVSVDTTSGAITYTPTSGYVGTDSLQYTVADSNGLVSAASTVSLNVGVTINNSTAKSLVFTDASGSKTTVILAGGGSAIVTFSGSGSAQTIAGPHHTGNVVVTGSNLAINGITISGSTIASTLSITRKGTSGTAVSGITVGGAIGKISAPTSTLSGNLNISGATSVIQFASISGANITIGSASARPGGVTVIAGSVANTNITSAIPINSIKTSQWTSSASTSSKIIAPSIKSLVTTGNFQAGINASGGSPFSVTTVSVGGQLGGETWSVTGNTANIVVGSISSGFNGTFSGSINSFVVKGNGFGGKLTAGSINNLSINGNDTGHLTAGTIRAARVTGQLNNATITLTGTSTSRNATSLNHLQVTGSTLSSTILSAGNIGSITTGGISGSSIDAGIASGVYLPSIAGNFAASSTISSFTVTGRGSTFVDSNIAAQNIGTLNLGTITTSNKNVAFGVAAGSVGALSGALDIGGSLHLNRTTLASSTNITTYLQDHSLSLGSFVIRVGL
jgi:hypothetical protein